jgi:hypothetical protein
MKRRLDNDVNDRSSLLVLILDLNLPAQTDFPAAGVVTRSLRKRHTTINLYL